MNDISDTVDVLIKKLDALRAKNPGAYLDVLRKLNASLKDLNNEFEQLKKVADEQSS